MEPIKGASSKLVYPLIPFPARTDVDQRRASFSDITDVERLSDNLLWSEIKVLEPALGHDVFHRLRPRVVGITFHGQQIIDQAWTYERLARLRFERERRRRIRRESNRSSARPLAPAQG